MLAAGSGFGVAALLEQWVADSGLACAPQVSPDAATLARLAHLRFVAGDTVPARYAGPLYVRDKVALDVDEQRALREKIGS